MSQDNARVTFARRPGFRLMGLVAILALLSQVLTACGGADATSTPAASAPPTTAPATAPTTAAAPGDSGEVINMLWTDTDNLRQPLIADFTKATGIKVNQVQVQYNEL